MNTGSYLIPLPDIDERIRLYVSSSIKPSSVATLIISDSKFLYFGVLDILIIKCPPRFKP